MTGRLVAVVGPSGSGKDTLIAAVRARLAGRGGILFARRTVTRADGGPEDHATLTPDAFAEAEAAGAFALSWRAHGLAYGLPAVAATAVAAGRIVVANLSRGVLDEAERRFGALTVVLVVVAPEILAARLAARGRETPVEVAARLARPAPVLRPTPGRPVMQLDNSGRVEEGAARLLALLDELAVAPRGRPGGEGPAASACRREDRSGPGGRMQCGPPPARRGQLDT